MGLLNYYGKFTCIPNLAALIHPLNKSQWTFVNICCISKRWHQKQRRWSNINKNEHFHSQTDGLIERFERTMNERLQKTDDWYRLVSYTLFAY